jgi:hypothetical protein
MLNKLIENKGHVGGETCESILGSKVSVFALADTWNQHAGLFHLIGANGLLEFCQVQTFNSEQLEAFKLGLEIYPKFLQSCLLEMEIEKKRIDDLKARGENVIAP